MFSLAIGLLLIILMDLYIIKKIDSIKINYSLIRTWLIIIIGILLLGINYIYCNNLIKFLLSSIIIFVILKLLLSKERNAKLIILVVICQLLTLIGETIFILFMVSIKNLNLQNLIESTFGTLLTNVCIVGITILLINIPLIEKFCKNVIKKIESKDEKYTVIIIVVSTMIINLILFSMYYRANLLTSILINSVYIIFITFVTYKILDNKNKLLQEQNKIMLYKAENDALINNLNAYEKVADKHRVVNHENKNQLAAIKQMILREDDRVVEYIDSLIGKTLMDNEKIIDKTKRIPSGGLQGIIYQKMLIMEKNKIKCSLNISKDLKDLDFKRLDIHTNVDLCKIVGVFLDNAIEEVESLSEKIIDIELYVDATKFCLSIANNYGQKTDFSKIGQPGYTTKGKAHGYGLTLVNDILAYNRRLYHERRVTTKYFTQIVKISKMQIAKKK